MTMEFICDLIKFLKDERVNLNREACSSILKLTGSKDGLNLLMDQKELLITVIQLVNHADADVAVSSWMILINISGEEIGAQTLIDLPQANFITTLIQCIQNSCYPHANFSCWVLSNLTRFHNICSRVLETIHKLPLSLEGLFSIFCQIEYNKKASLDYLASVISNFTQLKEGRRIILDKEKSYFERLVSFIDAPMSEIRRRAVIYAVHNCTFQKEADEWFLSDSINLATRLVMPLAGPDVFTIEENDSLPFDLQYLPDDKCREKDPKLRILLLESLMQLCTTRKCREYLRKQNIYLILREHHKWETDNKCVLLNEDVVDLIIKTEEEIGEDDLSTVEVPSDMAQKFTDFDEELLKAEET